MKLRYTHLNVLFLLPLLVSLTFQLLAQDNGQFIYGTIYTNNGKEFTGFIRWEDEELSWHDVFNSTKLDLHKVDKDEKTYLWGDFDWSISGLWEDKYGGTKHTFACQFGDISKLYIEGKEKVTLELKNGAKIKLKGGSNDIGATLVVQEKDYGNVNIYWKYIDYIEFFQAPARHKAEYASCIFGTAKTRRGEQFRGFIEWDQDERTGDDILHGDYNHKEQEIPFRNISYIEKVGSGSEVTLNTGERYLLTGSNDVSNGNRGVIVFQKGLGHVKIPWNHFESLELEDDVDGETYRDYYSPRAIEGKVYLLDGESISGQIIFDLDEMWDMEFLDGNDDNLRFEIPFRNVKKIIPKNKSYSLVTLRNGTELLLGETQDVSYYNDGLMIVRSGREKPVSVEWENIDAIIFK